jgi:epoxyqueuosine reductase
MIGSRILAVTTPGRLPLESLCNPLNGEEFYPNPGNHVPVLLDLMEMTETEFKERFRHSPVRRARYAGFMRNVAVALGNSHDPLACDVLVKSLTHNAPLVRSHAAWALAEIGNPDSLPALIRAAATEPETWVRDEFQEAINSFQSRPSIASNLQKNRICNKLPQVVTVAR